MNTKELKLTKLGICGIVASILLAGATLFPALEIVKNS